MKVALQFFGHLRTYDKCYPALKENIIDLYKPDIFIHTWDQREHNSRSWYKDSVRAEPTKVDDEVLRRLERLYQPKKIKVDKQQRFYDDQSIYGTHQTIKITLNGIKNMLLSQHESNNLRVEYEKECDVSYDVVIVIRPDVSPLEPLNLCTFKHQMNFNARTSFHMVHNSINLVFDRWIVNYPLVFDVFYLGKPDVINDITSAYKSFERYFIDYTNYLPEGVENPEQALAEYIRSCSIAIKLYRFSFAIRRVNSKDDIVWIPEEISVQESFDSHYKQHFKLRIKAKIRNACVILLNRSPFFIKLSFNKFVNRLVTIRAMLK